MQRTQARMAILGALLLLPVAGLVLLLAVPSLDAQWENHPSHFWLVLVVAVANIVLGVLTSEVDVAIVDVDFDLEGGLKTIRAAKALVPPVPTIAITSNTSYREQAVAAGTDELLQNPPAFADLQVVLVRALGKPAAVHQVQGSGAIDVDV